MAPLDFTILGGHGFIGAALAKRLRADGARVQVPGRDEIASGALTGRNLGHVVYAIGLTADFRTRLSDTVEAHVGLLDRLLNATRWDSWLTLSSTRVYGALPGPRPSREDDAVTLLPGLDAVYDLSKLLGEALCLARPEATCRVARLSNVFGPGMAAGNFLAAIAGQAALGQPVAIGEAPGSAKDYLPIDQATRLLASIARGGNARLYNVASGSQVTHAEVANLVSQVFSVPVDFAPGGALRRLPQIDVSRIHHEFGPGPGDVPGQIRSFLHNLKTAKDTP